MPTFEWWQQLKTVDSMYLQEKIIVVSRRRFCYILLKRINFKNLSSNKDKKYKDCVFLSCHICVSEWIYTLQLPECQGTFYLKQAQYLKFKWLQWDLNPQRLSLWTRELSSCGFQFYLSQLRKILARLCNRYSYQTVYNITNFELKTSTWDVKIFERKRGINGLVNWNQWDISVVVKQKSHTKKKDWENSY